MAGLVLGITLTLQGLILLGVISLSANFMGFMFLASGILWILASANVWSYNVPARRRAE